MVRIALDSAGDTVSLALTEYLGDRFGKYREILAGHGARFVPASKTNRCSLAVVPALLRDLTAGGFAPQLDPQIGRLLKSEADEATQLLEAGRRRLESAETALAGSGLTLYPYQRTGVEWLAPRKRALLADQMGLGKTVQALLALPDSASALVVVPAAVRRSWAQESARWRPDLAVSQITSGKQFVWPSSGEIMLCTYGMLPAEAEVPTPGCAVVVIADEAHMVKSPKSIRTKSLRAVATTARAHGGSTWLLTGTPLLNRPPELWAVLQSAGLAEEAFGSWPRFVAMFHGAKGRFGYEWGRADSEVPDCLRKVSLRRHRADVLPDLPTKTHRALPVNGLDRDTVAACDEVIEALRASGTSLDDFSAEISASAKQVLFERMSRARSLLATAKIPALLEIVESCEEEEEPVVVFSAHLPPVEALGQREGWGLITGATSADERGRLVEQFQAGALRGIAGTIGAMGVGVTLTRAHHLIMVDLAWTPALNSQAEDRLCRIGQDRGVIVTRLIADHLLDRRVTELLTAKQQLIEASVEAARVEADYHDSPAEDLARAAQEAQQAAAQAQQAAAAHQQEIEAQHAQERQETAQRLNGRHDGRSLDVRGKFRGPCCPEEDHAQRALILLAGLDPDHAAARNDVGFSATDGEIGHSFAEALRKYGRLSDKQWTIAVRLAERYRRQVGDTPCISSAP